MKVLTMFAQSN
jgi:hypothetical protein